MIEDICPICKNNGDVSIKELFECRCCHKLYCPEHVEPKPLFFVDWNGLYSYDGGKQAKIDYHMKQREDGHACLQYCEPKVKQSFNDLRMAVYDNPVH